MRHRLGVLAAALVVVGAIGPGDSLRAAPADQPTSVQPAAVTKISLAVNGTYQPLAGAFDCDAGSDDAAGQHNTEEPGILWYAAGSAPDYFWTDLEASGGGLSKTEQRLAINGTYTPLVGDFDGDLCSDILWYGPGSAADVLWWGGPSGFTQGVPIAVNGTYRPTTGHLGGQGFGILWYDPDGKESIWRPTGNRSTPFSSRTMPQVSGTAYQPQTFADPWSGAVQILWYAPGRGVDTIWTMSVGGTSPTISRSVPLSLQLSYRTASCGNYVLLHGPGDQVDRSLTISSTGAAQISDLAITGSFRVAASRGTHLCTTVWHAPGPAPDQIWLQTPTP